MVINKLESISVLLELGSGPLARLSDNSTWYQSQEPVLSLDGWVPLAPRYDGGSLGPRVG